MSDGGIRGMTSQAPEVGEHNRQCHHVMIDTLHCGSPAAFLKKICTQVATTRQSEEHKYSDQYGTWCGNCYRRWDFRHSTCCLFTRLVHRPISPLSCCHEALREVLQPSCGTAGSTAAGDANVHVFHDSCRIDMQRRPMQKQL